jgi:aminopeptidase N
MRSYKLLFAAIALSANAWGQPGAADSVQHITLDTLTIAATAGKPVYRAAAPRVWDIVHTRIALSFNRKDKTASAREWIKLHPYSYATDTLVLDAKSMKIDSVLLLVKGKSVPLNYSYANDLLNVSLGRQYNAADTITLQLQYTARP